MAWKKPGSNGDGPDGGRNPWKSRGNGIGDTARQWLGRLGDGGGIGRWVAVAVVLLLAFSCFQLIGEQQRGVVLRFGQFDRIMQPGPNFKLPWPLESVTKVNATQIKTFSNVVPVLTRDENIVNVSLNVQYRVADPRQYLYGSRDADQVLEQAAQSAVREQVGRSDLDAVLNKRGPLATSALDRLQASLKTYRTGLTVTGLTLPDARPPEEVKPAFDEVNGAQQVKERLINEAQAYAAKVVPEARGESARTRADAEAYKDAIVARAEGDADRFSLLQAQYKGAPDVTRKRLWLETVQKVLAENRKVVGGDGKQLIYVPMPAAEDGSPVAAKTAPAAAAGATPAPSAVLPALQNMTGEDRNPVRGPRPSGREESDR